MFSLPKLSSNERWYVVVLVFATINMVGIVALVEAVRQRGGADQPRDIEALADPGGCVAVQFPRPMIAQEAVGTAVEPGMAWITPGAFGQFVWRGTQLLSFVPDKPLAKATVYRVTLSGRLRDLSGKALGADREMEYHVAPLRWTGACQTDMTEKGEAVLTFEFDDAVSPQDLAKHLALTTPRGLRVRYEADGSEAKNEVRVRTEALPSDRRSLVARLTKGLRGVSGPLGIDEDQEKQVTVNEGLSIEEVSATSEEPGSAVISVRCSHVVGVEEAKARVRVEPEVKYALGSYWGGLRLTGPFEPGRKYRLVLQKGLRGSRGVALQRDAVRIAVIPDVEPAVRFKTRGLYMGLRGSLLLPLETVNVEKVEVAIHEVYPNNVIHFLRDSVGRSSWTEDSPSLPWWKTRGHRRYRHLYAEEDNRADEHLGRDVLRRQVAIRAPRNQAHVTNLDLAQMLGAGARGVFRVSASSGTDDGRQAGQLVMVTDLGISARCSDRDVLVWVNTISATRPVAGARVQVYSKTNQRLLDGRTDENGLVHFREVAWEADRTPFAVVASHGDDMAVLELARGALDKSPFDTGGRSWVREGYEAFIYADRGVYRPGETARLRAVIRSASLETPKPFPMTLALERPDGKAWRSIPVKPNAFGCAEVSLDVPSHALTGYYKASLRAADKAIGEGGFYVEEFLPDRMKAEAAADERRYPAGDTMAVTVRAAHLFGAPAAGRKAEAACEFVSSPFTPAAFPGFVFEDEDAPALKRREDLPAQPLDHRGERVFEVLMPKDLRPASAVMAVFRASVKEVGGRAVTAWLRRPVDAYPRYVGVMRLTKGHGAVGREECIRSVVVWPDGKPAPPAAVEAKFFRVVWNTTLKVDEGGRYRFHSERVDEPVGEAACDLSSGTGEVRFTPRQNGQYKVLVRDKEGGACAAVKFHVGQGGTAPAAWSMDKPARLDLVPDKESYAAGETVSVLVKSPFPGRALITVETDRVHLAQVQDITGDTGRAQFVMDPAWGANAYCTVVVVRALDAESPWAPARAFGTAPILLDHGPRHLKVELAACAEVRPGRAVDVDVRVADAQGRARRCEVSLAAVDEGICTLTGFETPDPWGFFYAKRRLEVESADLYSLLMPEVAKARVGSDSAVGGDDCGGDAEKQVRRQLGPQTVRRVKNAALWLGSVTTDDQGRGRVSFDAPDFAGQLRVMAVAVGEAEFGCAEQPVQVRQPVMVQPSFPRFLAPGDEFVVPVTVFNQGVESGEGFVEVKVRGDAALLSDPRQPVTLPRGSDCTATFRLKAPAAPGKIEVEVNAAVGGEVARETVEIPVRPIGGLQRVAGDEAAPADSTVALPIPNDWVAGTERRQVVVAPLPGLDLAESMKYVLNYPYGCIEQTTSRIFPILYLSDLARLADPEAFAREEVAEYVNAGLDRLLSMQRRGGGFGAWPGEAQEYEWGSIYATHCLVEARKAGYAVAEEAVDGALKYLARQMSYRSDPSVLPCKAYACMVLALAGKPDRSWTYRLYEDRDKLPLYSRCHVASALAVIGEPGMAAELMQLRDLPDAGGKRDSGGVLHSPVRELAILLSTHLDLDPVNARIPALVKSLQDARVRGRWLTTQENGFALLALGKYARLLQKEASRYEAEVRVDGKSVATATHEKPLTLTPPAGSKVEVTVRGQGRAYCHWWAEGLPLREDVHEEDSDLRVRRRLLDRHGNAIERIRLGDVVVVELSLANAEPVDNVVVSDLLPAGLEIENPRLATRDGAVASKASMPAFEPSHVERRDDRLLVFADFGNAGTRTYQYAARAVACGRFRLPPVSAHAMYRPDVRSTHGAGHVEVFRE